VGLLKRLDIGGDVGWPDGDQRQAAVLAPGEEPAARPGIGSTGVRVVDVGAKEFGVASAGLLAGFGDQLRHDIQRVRAGRDRPAPELGRKLRGDGDAIHTHARTHTT
jgi:hypothetical protein